VEGKWRGSSRLASVARRVQAYLLCGLGAEISSPELMILGLGGSVFAPWWRAPGVEGEWRKGGGRVAAGWRVCGPEGGGLVQRRTPRPFGKDVSDLPPSTLPLTMLVPSQGGCSPFLYHLE